MKPNPVNLSSKMADRTTLTIKRLWQLLICDRETIFYLLTICNRLVSNRMQECLVDYTTESQLMAQANESSMATRDVLNLGHFPAIVQIYDPSGESNIF